MVTTYKQSHTLISSQVRFKSLTENFSIEVGFLRFGAGILRVLEGIGSFLGCIAFFFISTAFL